MALRAGTVAPARGERFPRSQRLRRRKEFLRIQRSGVKVSSHPLVALALENRWNVTRVGITISSRVGNAVARNRIRRVLREIFRRHRARLPGGIDVVLIVSPQAVRADFSALHEAYCSLASQLKEHFR
jgi:ribonuclease P protein component